MILKSWGHRAIKQAINAPNILTLLFAILLLWSTASLTTVSGLHYVNVGMNLLQQTEENRWHEASHFP